jgi:hypothetical protein
VLVTGRVTTREEEQPKILVADVLPLERIAERFNCQLVIRIDKGLSEQLMDEALTLLSEYRGSVPVLLAARENGSEVYIRSRKYSVAVDFRLLDALKGLLGDSSAYLRPLPAKAGQVD